MVTCAQRNPIGINFRSVCVQCISKRLHVYDEYMMSNTCEIYNYADANTLGCQSENIPHPTVKLQRSIGELLNWFESNYMQANPNKFQFIIFDKHNSNVPVVLVIRC